MILAEDLLMSGSKSDIQNNISKLKKIQRVASDFVAKIRSESEIPDIRMSLIQTEKSQSDSLSINIGEIAKPNLRSVTETQIMQLHTSTPLTNRQTDTLKHTNTFNTKIKATLSHIFNPKISVDRYNPDLRSVLVLEGERSKTIVVSDCNNACVKSFCSVTSALRSKYKLNSQPDGLAKSPDQQVLVAVPNKRQILYLSILEDIRLTNTLTTQKKYYHLCVLPSNRLAVSAFNWYGESVDILGEGGDVIRSIPTEQICHPWCLAVRGDSLIVLSQWNKVHCVASSGNVTWESRDSPRLVHLVCVACDELEFIYVCDMKRECIIQVSRDGEVMRDVIIQQDGLSKPVHICCDGDKLYVAQKNGDIKTFTWHKD
ncbi:uncharacterized protein LOC121386431 [Gigantopelta aegis]|uniref:uncharacterized protein LOC121386431 n=1 Tax=Gigantopelta aegis TaxID=1735272 RepID=UPI001B88AED4|nr:uncharacterized protein LOC121386431 [Gigantopelta aegis]